MAAVIASRAIDAAARKVALRVQGGETLGIELVEAALDAGEPLREVG